MKQLCRLSQMFAGICEEVLASQIHEILGLWNCECSPGYFQQVSRAPRMFVSVVDRAIYS